MDVGSITATIRAAADEFVTTINGVKKEIKDIANETKEQAQKAQDAVNSIATGSKKVADETKSATQELSRITVVASATFYGMVKGIEDTITVTNKFKNSLLGLESTAQSMNVNLQETTEEAQRLVDDGLMPIGNAATGLKNLLQAGFGLDQAVIIMERFKDSAAFGRQASLSFGEAIASATEGIKNGNSILVDNAGVTKNLSIMLEEAGYKAQDLMRASTDAGVRQAIFNGILKETAHQSGDAAKLAGTLSGQMSQFQTQANLAKTAVGNALTPALQELYSVGNFVTKGFTDLTNAAPGVVSAIITTTVAATGLLAIFTAIAVILPKLRAGIELLNTTLLKSPWGWIILAIGAVIGVIYKLIAANQKAKREQEEYNKTLEETNRIKREGIQASEINERQKEIESLRKLTQEYDNHIKKIEELRQRQKDLAQGNITIDGRESNEQDVVRENIANKILEEKEAIRQLDGQLKELNHTYSSAKDRVDSLTGAIEKANKMNFQEIQTDVQKYQQLDQVNAKILESVEVYKELASKKGLNAKEAQKLSETMQYLIDVFGEDITVRNKNGEIISLNIQALQREANAVKNSSKEKKNAVREEIENKRKELQAEITRINGVIAAIDKEIAKWKELYYERRKAVGPLDREEDIDKVKEFQFARSRVGSLNSWKAENEKNIQDYKNALAELAGIRTQLDTAGSGTSRIGSSGAKSKNKNTTNEALQNALELYEYKKHMNQLTLQDEVKTLENIKSRYAKTAEEKRRLDMMIYDVKKEIDSKVLNEALDNYEYKKHLDQLTLEDQVKMLEEIKSKYAKNADDIKKIDLQIYDLKKEINEKIQKETMDSINKLNEGILTALRAWYEKERDAREQALQSEIESLDNWKDESEKRIKDVSDSKIKSIEESSKAQIKAIQGEIDAIDQAEKEKDRAEIDTEELKKINRLKEAIEYEHNEFNKAEMQKELNKLIQEREKRLHKEQIEDKKESLKDQIDIIKEDADKRKELLEQDKEYELDRIKQIYEAKKLDLNQQLEDIKTFYANKLTEANLQAEAERLIMDNNQKEIVKLLNSYAPDYLNAGKTLGQKLLDGFKPSIDEIKSMINSIYVQLDTARQSATNAMSNTLTGSTSENESNKTSGKTTIFKSDVTIVNPKATPSEEQRTFENAIRKMGYEWGLA